MEIVESEVSPGYVHMIAEIPPKLSISSFMRCLKGKNSTMLHKQFTKVKNKYGRREFMRRGCYEDTPCKKARRISEHMQSN